MHETDAMDFIGPVLLGFLCDYFPDYAEEDSKIAGLFRKIRRYIGDNEPYWVKEKAVDVINLIMLTGSLIKTGNQSVPLSPEEFVDTILHVSQSRVSMSLENKRPAKKGVFHFDVPPPEFP